MRLGDCYEQMGRMDHAVSAWDNACRLFLEQEQYANAARVCEKVLAYRPADQKTRRRLRRAQIQSDFHRALDSAIDNITPH